MKRGFSVILVFTMEKIQKAQKLLQDYQMDGWLLYDFRRSNPLACRFLEIPESTLLTRRFFYWIPKTGEPVKIVSTVENPLIHLPGKELKFRSWQGLELILAELFKGITTIAMEYSPYCAVPEVSKVDGGTIDLVRRAGPNVVSSGDLLQELNAVFDDHKWKLQQEAAQILDHIAENTWQWIAKKLSNGDSISEYDVQQWMLALMEENNCVTNHPPICAVNEHSSDPHYAPSREGSALIKKEDFILIDLWCKKNEPNAVYGDITRVAVAATQPSERHQEIFNYVKAAQDRALAFVKERYESGKPLLGFEVDRVCRKVIEDAGYGEYFVHRTGHNIDEDDHGPGAHIDDLETHDTRKLLPGTCFSIEPGIYLKGEFGVRLEYDVFLHPDGKVIVTGGIQDEIKRLSRNLK